MHACVLSFFSRVRLFATLWTKAHQAQLSLGFSRQEYWSGLPCPAPGNFPTQEPPAAPALQADSLPLSHGEAQGLITQMQLIISLAIGDRTQSPAPPPFPEVWGWARSFDPLITWLTSLTISPLPLLKPGFPKVPSLTYQKTPLLLFSSRKFQLF